MSHVRPFGAILVANDVISGPKNKKLKALINIDNFIVHNGPERISNSTRSEDLINQVIELTISTITLNKK